MGFTTNQIGEKASYGHIWMNTGNWTGVTKLLTTSYAELTALGTNFTLASPSQDFAMTTDGRLKYTGIKTKIFFVDAQFVITTFANNISLKLYKNGVALAGSETYTGGAARCDLCRFEVSLTTNDYLSIFVKLAGVATITICQINLSAIFAGGF